MNPTCILCQVDDCTVDSNLFYYLITHQREWKNENEFVAKDVKKGQSNNLNVNIIIAYHLKG